MTIFINNHDDLDKLPPGAIVQTYDAARNFFQSDSVYVKLNPKHWYHNIDGFCYLHEVELPVRLLSTEHAYALQPNKKE